MQAEAAMEWLLQQASSFGSPSSVTSAGIADGGTSSIEDFIPDDNVRGDEPAAIPLA